MGHESSKGLGREMSNEHLDMSGNTLDEPLLCHRCGKEVREEKTFGSAVNDELSFCSGECVQDWEDGQAESYYRT